jgi:hypothetical protein
MAMRKTIHKNDSFAILASLRNPDGTLVNLTGYTVTLTGTRQDGVGSIASAVGVLQSPATGSLITVPGTSTGTAGLYVLSIVATNGTDHKTAEAALKIKA